MPSTFLAYAQMTAVQKADFDQRQGIGPGDRARIEAKLDPHAWLDPIITSQAAHYGVTVQEKRMLFLGAALYQERIEAGIVDEPLSTMQSNCQMI